MYLKSLEINGFKSFARNTNLEFKTNISAIVGPNGSGKSNVAEAFRFALGEQSMKNMRGKKGEDLIFSGRSARMNRAGVKVIFDNKDKGLDIDYDQVQMERIVFRDGVNDYILNKNKVRAKDITELLGSANVGSSGHHIISQGEADKILSVNPRERREIIEEGLGLRPYIFRKIESENKLEKTENNLKEVGIKQKINTPRVKFLAKEVEKIEKIKEQKEVLEKLYQEFFPQQKKIKARLNEVQNKINLVILEKEELEKKIKFKKEDVKNIEKKGSIGIQKDTRIEKLEAEIKGLSSLKFLEQRNLARFEYELKQLEIKKENWKKEFSSQQKNEDEFNFKLNDILNIENKFFQRKTENFAFEILKYFGIRKDRVLNKDFNENEFEKIEQEIIESNKKLKNIFEKEDIVSKKIRILLGSGENTAEIFGQEIKIEILVLEKELAVIFARSNSLQNEKIVILKELESFQKEEVFAISIFGTEKLRNFIEKEQEEDFFESELNLLEKIQRIRIILENNYSNSIRNDSEELIKEYNELVENQEFVKNELEDLEKNKEDLEKIIFEITEEITKRFRIGLDKINTEFSKFFSTLFLGGKAEIFLIKIPLKKNNEEGNKMEEFEIGVDIKISLPNKKIIGLAMLSGGERSLVSIALVFAMSAINPPPFIILDETDAALDEANSKRYGDMIEKLSEHSQLILITHNRETMSRAGILYGITMDAEGISRLLSVSLEEAEKVAK